VTPQESSIILFDGVCNLCNHAVQFIIRRDPHNCFRFASIQSSIGQQLIAQFPNLDGFDSIILIEGDRAYTRSTAALRIAKKMNLFWKAAYLFIIIPRPLRDRIYKFVADNRYRWFGKQDTCMLPNPEIRNRFLDDINEES
jgi:predicted DCC family thiol-disulfide oxidoreductase YuxK